MGENNRKTKDNRENIQKIITYNNRLGVPSVLPSGKARNNGLLIV